MSLICIKPFLSLEINNEGNVYTCCPSYINEHKIGNIFREDTTSLEDIWYSKEAEKIRKKILNGDFSLCNNDLCRQKMLYDNSDGKYTKTPDLPRYITFAYDKECNLKCITCRDKKYKNDKEKRELLDKKIDSLLVPLLKNAESLALSGSGEAFFSKHSRKLLKKLAKSNPYLKFNINTNGLLFNKKNCNLLGLTGRINEVFVSLHAIDENLYKQIMIGSDYQTVIENIKWMAEAQKEKVIEKVTINSVISALNYIEIPKLADFAQKQDINITFSQFCDWGTKFGKEYENVAIWQENHPNHNDFVKILKNLNYEKIFLSPLFEKLTK